MKQAKCRSRKHSSYGRGCGSPRCPEGLYVKSIINDAIKNGDIAAYMEARQIQDNKKSVLSIAGGVATISIEAPDSSRPYLVVSGPLHRTALREQLTQLDKSEVPSFSDVAGLQAHIKNLYDPYLTTRLYYEENEYGWKNLYVADMNVDADLRSTGMGYHVRRMITKHCDEQGIILSGTPTSEGDRSYNHDYLTQVPEEEHIQRAIKHRARLEAYYLRSGYEKNFSFRYSINRDSLTGEYHEVNPEYRAQFNQPAQTFLGNVGEYVRWPNGIVPKNMLAGRRPKPDKEKLYLHV